MRQLCLCKVVGLKGAATRSINMGAVGYSG